MNILVLTSEYPYEKYPRPDWTPVVSYFARSWVKQGHRVVAIVNSSRFPNAVYNVANMFPKVASKLLDVSSGSIKKTGWLSEFSFNDQGVEVYNLPIPKLMPGGKYSQKTLDRQTDKIIEVLKKTDFIPDVVTGHWINPQLFLLARLKGQYKCKFGFVFHADYQEKKCKKFKVKDYIGKIDHVGCRNKFAAQEVQNYFTLDKPPFICSSGIPEEYLSVDRPNKRSFEGDKLTIVSAGRLVQYKNFDKLIIACKKAFPQFDFDLTIAGEGILADSLKRLVIEQGMEKCVSFPGRLSRDELQKKMGESETFALISDNETLGLVYIEAMAQGCITIASKRGGVDGIIVDGENGFLCEQGNSEELADIIIRISNLSNEEKKRISKNAIDTVVDYTDSKVAKRYLDAIIR